MQAFNSFLTLLTLTHLDVVMILVSMGLFFILWKTLDSVFFSRYLPYLEHREEATSGNLVKANQAFNEAKVLMQEVESGLRKARGEALSKRSTELDKCKQFLDVRLKSADDKLSAKLKADRAHLLAESQKIEALVVKSIPTLVQEVRNAVLRS